MYLSLDSRKLQIHMIRSLGFLSDDCGSSFLSKNTFGIPSAIYPVTDVNRRELRALMWKSYLSIFLDQKESSIGRSFDPFSEDSSGFFDPLYRPYFAQYQIKSL